eukprot:GHVP01036324.1.p1 GENE.GHVP01036324.1~~GHVP01036324.1.p1  ORF type:complete len:138 (-),score=18.86 GHVP01036324.1:206-592(-)
MTPEIPPTETDMSFSFSQGIHGGSCDFKKLKNPILPITTGIDYNVVAILGCQSGGKSTVLNELFGSNFRVTDSDEGTTQGIWMQVVHFKNRPLVILDVEGINSKELGGDREIFKNRILGGTHCVILCF